jgi:hypothetical protein
VRTRAPSIPSATSLAARTRTRRHACPCCAACARWGATSAACFRYAHDRTLAAVSSRRVYVRTKARTHGTADAGCAGAAYLQVASVRTGAPYPTTHAVPSPRAGTYRRRTCTWPVCLSPAPAGRAACQHPPANPATAATAARACRDACTWPAGAG